MLLCLLGCDAKEKTPQRGSFFNYTFFLVGKEGLEPSLLSEPAPKAGAYTNSATCPTNYMCSL